MLIAMSVYTYLRLIVDHGTPSLLALRQKEVDFCTGLIREKVSGGEGRSLGPRTRTPPPLSIPSLNSSWSA